MLTPPDLPLRLTTSEVCALMRFSARTLARRRREDPAWLPPSAVQGGRQTVFDREAVLKALGMRDDVQATPQQPAVDADAFRQARARMNRAAASRGGMRSSVSRQAAKVSGV